MHMHACTHTHTPIKFLLVPKLGKEEGKDPLNQGLITFFTICRAHENLMSHKFQLGIFPSIFQFVLFCKYLYSNDNVTFVAQPH